MLHEKNELQSLVAEQKILNRIYVIRGQKVMLDRDLAEMYGVETKVFNQSVKRNIERFPKDFMFVLSEKEWENLRSQIVTSSWGGIRYRPNVFTEQGVAMLSSILNSKTAIEVNIRIIRVFTRLREYALTHKDILVQRATAGILTIILQYLKNYWKSKIVPPQEIKLDLNNSRKIMGKIIMLYGM